MTSWLQRYALSIEERDTNEKADKILFDAYTRLADRSTSFRSPSKTRSDIRQGNSPTKTRAESSHYPSTGVLDMVDTDALIKAREDLSEAQRSRADMQLQLRDLKEEIKKLQLQSKLDNKQIGQLISEGTNLTTRLKDQNEELKGKAKLLEDVHDEVISLTLQLNMAEERSRKLGQENEDLVNRWMARMGEVADAVNTASKFS